MNILAAILRLLLVYSLENGEIEGTCVRMTGEDRRVVVCFKVVERETKEQKF